SKFCDDCQSANKHSDDSPEGIQARCTLSPSKEQGRLVLKGKKMLSDDGHRGNKSQAKKNQQGQETSRRTTSRPQPNTLIVAMEELGLTFAPTNVPPPSVASAAIASPSPHQLQHSTIPIAPLTRGGGLESHDLTRV
ncbi:hypothetical protein PO909_029489, partial [Leuciscus waleckii]